LKYCLTQLFVPMIILAMVAMATTPLPTEASPVGATRSVTQGLPEGECPRDLGHSGAVLPTVRALPSPKPFPKGGLDFDPSERSPSMSVAKASSERYDWPGEGETPVLRLCLTVGDDNVGLLPIPSASLALDSTDGAGDEGTHGLIPSASLALASTDGTGDEGTHGPIPSASLALASTDVAGDEGTHGPNYLSGPGQKLQTPLRPKSLTDKPFPPPVSIDANAGRLFGQLSRFVAQKLKTITTAGLSRFGPWPDWFRRMPAPAPMDGLFPTLETRPSDRPDLGPDLGLDLGPDLTSLERGQSLSLAKTFGRGSSPPEAGLDPFPEMPINGSHGPATAFLIPAGLYRGGRPKGL
jgi:hypothetical protein